MAVPYGVFDLQATYRSTAVALMIRGGGDQHPLDSFGMPTCLLLTQPLVSLPASTSTAQALATSDRGLSGVRFFVQWLIVDPGANRASLGDLERGAVI